MTDGERSTRMLVTEVSVKANSSYQDLKICFSHLSELHTASQSKFNEQVNLLQSQLDNLHNLFQQSTHPTDTTHPFIHASPPDWRAAHEWFCPHCDTLPIPSTSPLADFESNIYLLGNSHAFSKT